MSKRIFILFILLLGSLVILMSEGISDFQDFYLPAGVVNYSFKTGSENKLALYNLSFETEPENADYVVKLPDGTIRRGETPFEETVPPGKVEINISRAGYQSIKKEINLTQDYSNKFYLDPPRQIVNHLFNINSVPSPKGLAFTPSGKEIWVALLLNKSRGVSVFDSSTGEKIEDINLNGGGGVEIIFNRDGSKAYVSQMETGSVFEIDARTKEILRTFDTKSTWTKVLELSRDEKMLYASNWCGDEISVIDLKEEKVIDKIPAVDTPRGIYVTKDKKLYIAGFANGQIQKVDLSTGKSKIIFDDGESIRHIVGDEEKGILYVSDMAKGVIWKVFLKNDKVKKFAETDTNPNTIDLGPENKILFVSCRGKNASPNNYYVPGPEWGSVLLFDTSTGEMLDAIVGGNQPTALDFSHTNRLLGFSNFLDSQLEIYKVPSYGTLKQGNGGRSKTYKEELIK